MKNNDSMECFMGCSMGMNSMGMLPSSYEKKRHRDVKAWRIKEFKLRAASFVKSGNVVRLYDVMSILL